MPILENQRHELFAQGLAQGMSADRAYSEAGYKPDRPHASRLATNGNIRQRVEELQSHYVKTVFLNREWVIEQLIDNAKLAKADKDYGPANKAIELLGRELGMFIERAEVGTPGEFDGLNVEDKRGRSVNLLRQFGITRRTTVAGRS